MYISIPHSIVLLIERVLYAGAVLSGDRAFLPQQHQEIGNITIHFKDEESETEGLMNGAVSHI